MQAPAIKTSKGSALNRRDFVKMAGLASIGVLSGCASNPVTGENQLMLVSRAQEIAMDRQKSPHQFSADYGPALEPGVNQYLSSVGNKLARVSHRPDMPYSYRAVNATYINAYAFPGGSIAATRGILVSIEDEAELAGLLGHETGHVNARHTASRMSKGLIARIAVAGVSAYAASRDERLAPIAAGLGGIGVGLLLANYSRSDERQADSLGMQYMVKAGHSPDGMVELMTLLEGANKNQPSAIQTMFATHPMSSERLATARQRSSVDYAEYKNYPKNRERYMDSMAPLRKKKTAIEKMQMGERSMGLKKYNEAETLFAQALKDEPKDYAGLLMMAKCQLAKGQNNKARRYASKAHKVYPQEPQAEHLIGMANLHGNNFQGAYQAFNRYERELPGNPNTIFLKALSLEGMKNHKGSAREYYRYLQSDRSSRQAKYAYGRLQSWGYLK